jgi:hypothetical protein
MMTADNLSTQEIVLNCNLYVILLVTYIYMTQVYTCYSNTVFYFDTSYSLSSQHVSAPRAIIRRVTNIKFLYFKKTSHSTDPLFLSFTMNYYNFVFASYILKSSKNNNKYKYKIIKTIIRLPLVLS